MKYSDIITTKEGYHPVFNLQNEVENEWKRFIINENFYTVLRTVMSSIDPVSSQEKRRSIWMRGTYGTGKSHATSVIKHLLWDDMNEIEEFLDSLNDQYKSRLKSFRKNNKAFPVIINGASNIVDNRSFSNIIQKAVFEALEEKGISITTETDFQKWYTFVEDNKEITDWDKHIKKDKELKIYVKNTDDLLKKLKSGNVKVLKLLEESANKRQYHVSVPNINDWLKEVVNEIRKQKIADYLIIYWDEFTSILELEQRGLDSNGVSSSEWQNIAELSKNNYVYLFIVSHRFPSHYSEDDRHKALDRFNTVEYLMQPLTTYHIMKGAIKKINEHEWVKLRKQHVDSNSDFVSLIYDLIGDENVKVSNTIMDLYPIHPYTSYLITFISRYMGSAQRSVFNFLTDNEHGFLKFISENPNGDKGNFLTPSYLWDFFISEFETMEQAMAAPILDKYKNNWEKVQENGDDYLNVFKSVLLLNILNNVTKVSESSSGNVVPSKKNIENMYIGTEFQSKVPVVLDYLHDMGVVQRSPYGIYEVTASTLNTKKVNDEEEKLRQNFSLLKTLDKYHITALSRIFSIGELRHIDVKIYDADEAEHIIQGKLHKDFDECKHDVCLGVFIARSQASISKINKSLVKFSKDENFNHIIFVSCKEHWKEENFESYLKYRARANIADSINDQEQKNTNEENADKIIHDWIDSIQNKYATYFFRGKEEEIIARDLIRKINNSLSKELYSSGLENTPAGGWDTIWKSQSSQKAVEIMLVANNRDDLDKATQQFLKLQEMLKDTNSDWIVDSKLNIKKDADKHHPLILASDYVKTAIDNAPKHNFHLGLILQGLSESPFGYYKNIVNQGALAFLLRSYVEKLYESGTGTPIDKTRMRDKILSIFEFWADGNERANILQVRFGTEEEKDLIEKLSETFKLENDAISLNDIRWKIRNQVKERGYPLWVYKEFAKKKAVKNAIDNIGDLIRKIDKEIDDKTIDKLLMDLKETQMDLYQIINDKIDVGAGFTTWLLKIDNIDESDLKEDKDLENLMTFLKKDLQEEIPFWEEDKVTASVLQWKINRMSSSSEGTGSSLVGIGSKPFTPNEKTLVQKTLDDFQGDIKKALFKAIEDNPHIWNVLKKYLEEAT